MSAVEARSEHTKVVDGLHKSLHLVERWGEGKLDTAGSQPAGTATTDIKGVGTDVG
jgi:hypothetical protein